jgi:hypothetical protein
MLRITSLRLAVLLVLFAAALAAPALAETLYQIKVEHNHRQGECQGTLIVRDDKVIFESRNADCSRVWEYGAIERIDFKSAWEFHVFFSDSVHGKDQKYVMKFRDDNPDNKAAIGYIQGRMGPNAMVPASQVAGNAELPYRLKVELDLNGPNCMGTLVLSEDKIVFETGAAKCADRAFVREWGSLKEYRRLDDLQFLLVFYKYGRSAPKEVTELRFWAQEAIPQEVHRMLVEGGR